MEDILIFAILISIMQKIIPPKLKHGDTIRIVAPSMSMAIIGNEEREIANKRLTELGFTITFGKHIEEIDEFESSSIESRIEDLHEAFADKDVKALITVVGGFNCNQLFRYIDWNLIQNNPKIIIGFSDTTGLENAIYAKTGVVTYSGPSYAQFGQKLYADYQMDYFKKCLMSDKPYTILPSEKWSNDAWWENQDQRILVPNEGYFAINEGKAEGTLIGGNHSLMGFLQGTEYFPDLTNSILFLEDDYEIHPNMFDANLQSLIHLPSFPGVKGIVIGRFEKKTKMTNDLLQKIIKTKKELTNLPVIANVDFGHTDPIITFPVGGATKINVTTSKSTIEINEH